MDEKIGSVVFTFDHKDLEPGDQFETVTRPVVQRWDTEGAWEIRGKVVARRSGPVFG